MRVDYGAETKAVRIRTKKGEGIGRTHNILDNKTFGDLHPNILGGETNITPEEYGIEHPGDVLVMDTNYLREELLYTTDIFNHARRNIV